MSAKEEFIEIYRANVHREAPTPCWTIWRISRISSPLRPRPAITGPMWEGCVSTASTSTTVSENIWPGSGSRSLYGVEAPDESVAVSALLHDLCKIGCYKAGSRNVKGSDGKWTAVPTFYYEDKLPYGHGEKSVYIISGFMKLTRPEAMAIRWHMGFSGGEDSRLVGQALQQYPLAFALSVADMEATYFLEREDGEPSAGKH